MLRPPQYVTLIPPTEAEMDKLMPGEYILHDADGRQTVCVRADHVDRTYIDYTCAFCFSHCNTFGKPTKRSKNFIHSHGSGGNLLCRNEHRASHCYKHDFNGGVQVYITPSTRGSTVQET